MKKSKIAALAILTVVTLLSINILSVFADSNNGYYIVSKALPSNIFQTPPELKEGADYIFEGTLTGIHFEIVDNKTGSTLDANDLPEGLEEITFYSDDFIRTLSYEFYTVYEINVTKTYKGNAGEQVDLYFDHGLREYKEDEQLKLISDLGFKNPYDQICYLDITSGDYGSHINVGNKYLFFGIEMQTSGKIRAINQYYYAFGEDYPYSNKNRPFTDFIERFNYDSLTKYLNGESPEGQGDHVNYALASNGARYVISTVALNGEEQDPAFYDVYRDDNYTKLTDGATSGGMNDESSVTLFGKGKTRVKFDLGQVRTVNRIILRNFVMQVPTGEFGPYHYFSVSAGKSTGKMSDINVTVREEQYGADGLYYNIILDFDTVAARFVFITADVWGDICSLDEAEIYGIYEQTEVIGDINGDNEANSLDATMILKYDAGIAEFVDGQIAAADVNGDGEANSLDATLILKYDAGLTDEL